jgi:hypothetical protein
MISQRLYNLATVRSDYDRLTGTSEPIIEPAQNLQDGKQPICHLILLNNKSMEAERPPLVTTNLKLCLGLPDGLH